ncbi:MAG: DUF1573 domain-containing protein [Planctomycetes bacterium]|nr:DUF1573 domain-containing protein [Planctomycetota bacterium]MBM4080731.1 DUF1573 domain-containing protein [Planctomycetota bacterium]
MKAPLLAAMVLVSASAALAQPKMEVDNDRWDFGEVWQQATAEHGFIIRNAGDQPLVISAVKASCPACVAAMESGKVILPGESGRLSVSYYAKDRRGKQTESLTVMSNDPQRPSLRLWIAGTVREGKDRPILDLPHEKWDAGLLEPGESRTWQMPVRNVGLRPLRVLEVTASEACSILLPDEKEVAPGKEIALRVTVQPRITQGVIQQHLVLRTDDPVRPSVTMPIVGYVLATGLRGQASGSLQISYAAVPVAVPGTGRAFFPAVRFRNGLSDAARVVRVGSVGAASPSRQEGAQLRPGEEREIPLDPGSAARTEAGEIEIVLRLPLLPTR